MFAGRYWAPRFWARDYWPGAGAAVAVGSEEPRPGRRIVTVPWTPPKPPVVTPLRPRPLALPVLTALPLTLQFPQRCQPSPLAAPGLLHIGFERQTYRVVQMLPAAIPPPLARTLALDMVIVLTQKRWEAIVNAPAVRDIEDELLALLL